MKKLFLILALSLYAQVAWAQNPQCPTRPFGTSDNSCASTAFVQAAIIGLCTSQGAVLVGTGTSAQCSNTINSATLSGVSINNANTAGVASYTAFSDLGASAIGDFGVRNSARVAYGALVATDGYAYSNNSLTLMADNATGKIKFATGGNTQTAQLSSAGTFTLAPTPATVSQGYLVSQTTATSGSSSQPTALAFNDFAINNQIALTGAGAANPFSLNYAAGHRVIMTEGGANVTGFQIAGLYRLNHTVGDSNIGVADHIVLATQGYTTKNSNGHGFYGMNPAITAGSGASHSDFVGLEADVEMDAGSQADRRAGLRAYSFGTVQGTLDYAIGISNFTNVSAAWKDGILFSDVIGLAQSISATGNIMRSAAAMTVDTVFNFSNLTVTTNILNFPNAILSGAGTSTWPIVAGGSGAASTLTLESTTGAGTTDAILFKTASQSEKMRVTTSGDLLIGLTTAPALGDSGNGVRLAAQGAGSTYGYVQLMSAAVNVAEMGRFSFGSPNFSGADKRTAVLRSSSTTAVTTIPTGNLEFFTNNGTALTAAMSISPTQVVAMTGGVASSSKTTGTAVVTGGIGISGATFTDTLNIITVANASTTAALCWNSGSGLVTENGAVGTCTVSDGRLKNVEGPIKGALDKLLKINGVYFTWKDQQYGKGRQAGIIAQDVEKVFPELVSIDDEGKLSADYQRLTAPIIEALREINGRIEVLERGR